MTVHIGIVTFNSLHDLPACFEGIRSQTYAPLTITVVDNASTDESANWVAQNTPEVSLIHNSRNVGFGAAHNQIIKTFNLAENDCYLALNPDVVMQANYIQAIIEAIQPDDRIGWATGKLLLPVSENLAEPLVYSVGHALFRNGYTINIGHRMADRDQFDQSREVFGAPGAAVVMKAAFIQDLSINGVLFDPDMFMYGEDIDVDWRARRRGWQCRYVANAIAIHRDSMPNSALKIHALRNRYLSVFKNANWLDLLIYNAPIILLHCAFRIIFTPRQGIWLTSELIRLAPRKIRQRQSSTISRSEMQNWFKWAKQQPTNQPASLVQRLGDFFAKWRQSK